MRHEGLLLLFRNRPTLAPELPRDALGLGLPAWSEARVESAELTEVVPTEYRADLVVLLLEGRPVFAIVVEVQLARDEDKRKTWPLYLTSLRSRVGCPTAFKVRPWRPKYQKRRPAEDPEFFLLCGKCPLFCILDCPSYLLGFHPMLGP